MKIRTGKGPIPLSALLAIWSVSAVASLPGLAVSPILGDMNRIFPHATDLEIQMLTSLPSLLVIPFVLLSGKISERRNKFTLLATGLALFFLSGVACLFAGSMTELIVISSLLGVGAGMVIPLSTGLVVDYFTGDYRVRQLGYSSAINNLTLVLATALAGYLANIEWHLPFLVYTLPGISFAAVFLLRRTPAAAEPPQSDQLKHTSIDWRKLAGVMALYFAITFLVLTVTYYISFLVEARGLKDSLSGVLISLFFLAIMLPGFLLRRTIQLLRQPGDARDGLPACRFRLWGDAAAHLRQGGHRRTAPHLDARLVARHGDELPGRRALPLRDGPPGAPLRARASGWRALSLPL